jgi:hypothetical protein
MELHEPSGTQEGERYKGASRKELRMKIGID